MGNIDKVAEQNITKLIEYCSRNDIVSDTGSVLFFRWGTETPTLLGRLERTNLNH
jgi:hypothetical protein